MILEAATAVVFVAAMVRPRLGGGGVVAPHASERKDEEPRGERSHIAAAASCNPSHPRKAR